MPFPTPADKLALLGHPPDARLLIVNGDDLGMCHAANVGTFEALEGGLMTSASLMVPCAWAYDACLRLQARPDLDAGIHLTLNCDWDRYRWGPVLGADRCPSLVDAWGFFHRTEDDLYARGNVDEVLAEADAQIQRAIAWGLDPTHLDGHRQPFYTHPSYLPVYVELARRYDLPLRLPHRLYKEEGAGEIYDALPLDGLLTADDLRFVPLEDPPTLRAGLLKTLRNLHPGITELCLHAAAHTPEGEAVMTDLPARVEAQRLMLDDSIREEIDRLGIILIGWRTLRDAQRRSV